MSLRLREIGLQAALPTQNLLGADAAFATLPSFVLLGL
jgi:hypothetical protein